MVEIFGQVLDPISLIPAIFATLLSIYNWYQLRKPADIYPYPLIEYGYIQSDYHKGYQLCLPMMFYNKGSNRGLITSIQVRFQSNPVIELEILGRAQMNDLSINAVYNFDWDSFEEEGYTIRLPTYPIAVEGKYSEDVIMIAQSTNFPIGKHTECQIIVGFDDGRTNSCKFPFYLSKESAEVDNMLRWYKSIEN